MEYKVLITTSGLGSRLGELTKYTNKSLVRVGDKPALSYIIEAYPSNVEIVITLGHYGDHVKDFLLLAYPERKFSFVEIDKFEGPGSSLVYSMSKAEEFLQCPFIFHACDTIVMDNIPEPSINWLGGGHPSQMSTNYRTLTVKNGLVIKINDKGELSFDNDYIGVAGIFDYEVFWGTLKEILEERGMDNQLSDCHVINNMGKVFKVEIFTDWLDIGNSSSLKKAREHIGSSITVLDKNDESIFILDQAVIKFFHNKKTAENRVRRALVLKDSIPKILGHRNNFYKYEYVKGDLFADVADTVSFKDFLFWAKNNLWKDIEDPEFNKRCIDFYQLKTWKRVVDFIETNKINDEAIIINGVEVPGAKYLLSKINLNKLCESKPSIFHGDLILDNIIKTITGFKLLDWRQDFGGSIESGDIYYDLSKLNHNLIVNHKMIDENNYQVLEKNGQIICTIHLNSILNECKDILHQFIIDQGFCLEKVKIITALIWLNMSPLHHYPFNQFLYYFGRYNLYKEIKNAFE